MLIPIMGVTVSENKTEGNYLHKNETNTTFKNEISVQIMIFTSMVAVVIMDDC